MKLLGLIGHPLSHSFSEEYFQKKFNELGLTDFDYKLFDLPELSGVKDLEVNHPELVGLNVTIPYKASIIPHLENLDENAREIGAVNTITIRNSIWTGYNTDYFGFKESLFSILSAPNKMKALILGSGGSSKAVQKVFRDLNIDFKVVSRQPGGGELSYQHVEEERLIKEFNLIINTTPLGMYPNINELPRLDYDQITKDHILFDLIYNPEKTAFLIEGEKRGALTKNGLEMLYIQAERSWEIWRGNQ